MPIRVPAVAVDAGVKETRHKSGPGIESIAFPREDWVASLLPLQPDGFEGGNRVGVQMYGSADPFLVFESSTVRQSRWTCSHVSEYCSDASSRC
jgi:hypothetical protein